MKRLIPYLMMTILTVLLSFTGCSSSKTKNTSQSTEKTITLTTKNKTGEDTEVVVPYDAKRLAVLDMAALDILDSLGVGDRVVGSASTSLPYLKNYMENDSIANIGTIKEADLEAIMACEPDVIFIGNRLASSYDALSEIAPVILLAMDTEIGVVESIQKNTTEIASIFGLEEKVEELMTGFDSRIQELKTYATGKNAIIGMCTSGSFNVLGDDGRCSIISKEIGFENIGIHANADTSTHGNEASFEFLADKNPDYIFVLDRDAAIGADGVKLAQEIMENELVMTTDTYKNGTIVYLAHPAVWYTAEGGIRALDIMLNDLESALNKGTKNQKSTSSESISSASPLPQ